MWRVFVWMYIYIWHMCLLPVKTRRGCLIPWNCSYGWLWAVLWVLGTRTGFSVRVTNSFNHQVTSPAPRKIVCKKCQWVFSLCPSGTVDSVVGYSSLGWQSGSFSTWSVLFQAFLAYTGSFLNSVNFYKHACPTWGLQGTCVTGLLHMWTIKSGNTIL